MNDPNGLIVVDGIYHLFFQHDPASIAHGPMHWGHATSKDLVNWTEQSTALYPNELGACFSGSAVETSQGEVKLFYTAHRQGPTGQDLQAQCLVHADRQLTRFMPDPRNPVVPNPGLAAFRDPKVVWHAPTSQWIMLVTEGQSIGFYASTDLVQWSFLSRFGEGHGRHSRGPWECPDLLPLQTPGGMTMWVLIVGLNPGGYAPGSGTQYFIGTFDGVQFQNANAPETELWLDHGRDYYAAQTFFDREGRGPPIAMAWASNWLYARQTPTAAFRGVMSLPRELSLVETGDGLRVAMNVPANVRQSLKRMQRPGAGCFDFDADLRVGQQLQVRLFGESHPQFTIIRDAAEHGRVHTSRGAASGMDHFGHDYSVPVKWPETGPLTLSAYVDRGLVELSTSSGLLWITNLFYPSDLEAKPLVEAV